MSTWNELAMQMLGGEGPAALVCRQWLMPAEGRDAVIFPPTFAAAEGGGKAGYNIDALGDPNDVRAPPISQSSIRLARRPTAWSRCLRRKMGRTHPIRGWYRRSRSRRATGSSICSTLAPRC
jgi:hypothetical protein